MKCQNQKTGSGEASDDSEIQPKEDRIEIADLRSDAAAGPDRIRPRLLKEMLSGLAPALAVIQQINDQRRSPQQLEREANVTREKKPP